MSPELGDLFTGPARVWSYGGSIVGPIFTGGAIAGQVAQATAAQKAALAAAQLSIQTIRRRPHCPRVDVKLREELPRGPAGTRCRTFGLARLQFNGAYAPYSTVLRPSSSRFPQS